MASRRRAFALLAVALLAGACSGSGSTDAGGSTEQTKPVEMQNALTTKPGDVEITTTTGPRKESTGKVVYGWHTAVTPSWLDPQEASALITPYAFMYAMHDSMIKSFDGKSLQPSLAESYKMADDFKSISFVIREGAKFQNGDPVTSDDVEFSYKNYRGTQAQVFKDKLDRIEKKDARNITFYFKEPFVDFLVLYGTPATGIGWIVPKAYYEKVGADGFKQAPIGAGPYKLIRNTSNAEFELEAFKDYWRKSPETKTLIYKVITDDATRFAALQTGEIDLMNVVQGALLDAAKANKDIRLIQRSTVPFWIEMPGWEKPDSPFHDVRVRKAVSLALNRQEITNAETGGFARIDGGNWGASDTPGALSGKEIKPEWYESNLAKAKQLMAEAGYPNGFEVPQLTPLAPYYPLGERVITQLAQIGIKTKLNKMERAAFTEALNKGPDALPGLILWASGLNGDMAARYRSFLMCKEGGYGSSSRTCMPDLDAKFKSQYETSTDAVQREKIIKEIQTEVNDRYVFPYVYNLGLTMATGPRVLNTPEEIWFSIPQYVYVFPFEDIKVKA
jgi:peptide/nickel transport system substrate-binding protein